jgi:hypothetical protein
VSRDARPHTGSCLCEAVKYQVTGPLRPVVACHCTQCRKTSGHFVAATSAPLTAFRLTEDRGLKWYRSSGFARRGFCGRCGANLFWQRDGADRISIMAGTLDGPTGLTTEVHIFCADAGDYYEIPDDTPQFPGNRTV